MGGCGAEDSPQDGVSDGSADSNSSSTTSTTGATSNASTNTSNDGTPVSGTSAASATTNGSGTSSGATGNGGVGIGDGATDDGTSSAASDTSTSGGAGGGAGAGGSEGVGGSGGTAAEPCPATPPANGSSCFASGPICAYEDCAGNGRSVANCFNGSWSVANAACGETVGCNAGPGTCGVGEICLVLAGGALLGGCVANTCETGPVSCDCIEGCSGECGVTGDPDYGITITCNTCPSGLCP